MTADLDQIRSELIRALHFARYREGKHFAVSDALIAQQGWDRQIVDQALQSLKLDGWIRQVDSAPSYRIMTLGVVHAESEGLAQPDVLRDCEKARTEILGLYFEEREQGKYAGLHVRDVVDTVVQSTGFAREVIYANHDFLEETGALDNMRTPYFLISLLGVQRVIELRLQAALSTAFEELEHFPNLQARGRSQERGRQFQRLFGQLAEADGWAHQESVTNVGEEIDQILKREGSFILVECRWTAKRVQAKAVRDFVGKLRSRVGIQGLVASMSGFTAGADDEAQRALPDRPLVLFGPTDLRALFSFKASFSNMLAAKKETAIVRRRVEWA